jgi:hypothetical protein
MSQTLQDIYNKYYIFPNLQEHMLRVAGVARIICENIDADIDTESVVTACLLHDMGNIIKYDLGKTWIVDDRLDMNEMLEVQKQFRDKYGMDEHAAHMDIGREIGISGRVLELMDAIDFSRTCQFLEEGDMEKLICKYADTRVAPDGVATMQERLDEGSRRYQTQNNPERPKIVSCFQEIEKKIFEKLSFEPDFITEEKAFAFAEEFLQKTF